MLSFNKFMVIIQYKQAKKSIINLSVYDILIIHFDYFIQLNNNFQ